MSTPAPGAATRVASVLVADGQQLMAESLARSLRRFGEGIEVLDGHPPAGLAVVEAVVDGRPDVLLLDYWMPGLDGPSVTRMVLARGIRTDVMLLGWLCGRHQVNEGFHAGARAVISKRASLGHVLTGIQLVLGGQLIAYDGNEPDDSGSGIELRVAPRDPSRRTYDRLAALSPREVEILQALGTGVSVKQAALQLHIAPGTVRNHLHNMLGKTGTATQQELLALARRGRLVTSFGPIAGTVALNKEGARPAEPRAGDDL